MGKARKHTPEQIVNILRQTEVATSNGKTTPAASREAGITEQSRRIQKPRDIHRRLRPCCHWLTSTVE